MSITQVNTAIRVLGDWLEICAFIAIVVVTFLVLAIVVNSILANKRHRGLFGILAILILAGCGGSGAGLDSSDPSAAQWYRAWSSAEQSFCGPVNYIDAIDDWVDYKAIQAVVRQRARQFTITGNSHAYKPSCQVPNHGMTWALIVASYREARRRGIVDDDSLYIIEWEGPKSKTKFYTLGIREFGNGWTVINQTDLRPLPHFQKLYRYPVVLNMFNLWDIISFE